MTTALLIGRFQPLHKGHIWLMRQALAEHDELVIGIGSAQYSDLPQNPFSAEERKEMLERALKAEGVFGYSIVLLEDMHSNEQWVRNVLGKMKKIDMVFAGQNKLVARLFKEAGLNVVVHPRYQNISSSDIRQRIVQRLNWKHLVPDPVAAYMDEIEGADSVRDLLG